jgi:hypothetical protein
MSQVGLVNLRGLEIIQDFLGVHHKLGRNHFSSSNLAAWASDAESNFDPEHGGQIEIRSWDSVSGVPVVLDIDLTCFDVYEVEE